MPRRSHTLSVTLPNYGALVLSRICGKLEGAVSVLDVEQENRGEPNTGVILLRGILKMDEVDSIVVLLKVAYDVDEMFALKTEARYMADMSSNSGVARHHGFYAVYEGYPFGCSILDYHTNVLGSSLSSMGDEHFRKQIVPLVVGLHQTHNLDLEFVSPFSIRMQNHEPVLIECVKLKHHKCAYTENIEASRGTLRPELSDFPCELVYGFIYSSFPSFWPPPRVKWYFCTIKSDTITSPSFLYELSPEQSYVASIPGEQRWARAVKVWKEIALSWKSYHPEAQSPPTNVELDYKKYLASRYPWYTRWEALSGLLSLLLLVFALVVYNIQSQFTLN